MGRTRLNMEQVEIDLARISTVLGVLLDTLDEDSAGTKKLGGTGVEWLNSRIETTYLPSLYLIRDCIYDLAEKLREAQ